MQSSQNSFEIDGNAVSLDELIHVFKESKEEQKFENKAKQKRVDEQKLKPYQTELIKLQKHLENNDNSL